MMAMLLHQLPSDRLVLAKSGRFLGEEPLDPGDVLAQDAFVAEEQFEQKLAPDGLWARGLAAPGPERLKPPLRDFVDLAFGAARAPLGAAPGEALSGEASERRIDLPVALAPEVADARGRLLPDVVARHRHEAQHAEDRVRRGFGACVHIS